MTAGRRDFKEKHPMTNALAVRNEITLSRWEVINQLAPAAHASRLFGVGSPAAAAMIMAKGCELGLPFTASFDLVHVIDGKPSLSPRGALAIIHNSPECVGVRTTRLTDDKGNFAGYECWMKRRSGFEYTVQFTLADAKRAHLTEGSPTSTGKRGYGNWEKYPENMSLWRAIGFCADVVFPDVLGGMKTADQYGADITVDGDVIPGQWSESQPDGPDETADAAIAAQALVEEYGAEAVLQANDGQIPATLEEVDAVRYALIAAEEPEGEAAS